jgi:hypothetical protein
MTWAAWRLQRTESLIAAAMLAALALLLVPSGLHMASVFDHDKLAECLGVHTSFSCDQQIGSFSSRFNGLNDLLAWTTLLPGLMGVLLAAPFVLELENGTYRLAWTQSVTRGRWLTGKLGLAVGAALAAAVLFTLLMTWWHDPLVRLHGRMETTVYDAEGTVVLGYTLFGLALAVAIGALWRRAVPALLVAFGAYFATRLFVDTWLRQRLITPLSATWSMSSEPPKSFRNAWVLSENMSDRLGNAVAPPFACGPKLGRSKGSVVQCLADRGAGYTHAVFHPASHFWTLQGLETAMFGGVALVLLAFAAWWVHERSA